MWLMATSFLIDFSYLALKVAARLARVPLPELAEAAVAKDRAKQRALGRDQQLDRILKGLQSYQGESLEQDAVDFAHAEVFEEDPLRARRVFPRDTHGVGAAFGHRLERRSP